MKNAEEKGKFNKRDDDAIRFDSLPHASRDGRPGQDAGSNEDVRHTQDMFVAGWMPSR